MKTVQVHLIIGTTWTEYVKVHTLKHTKRRCVLVAFCINHLFLINPSQYIINLDLLMVGNDYATTNHLLVFSDIHITLDIFIHINLLGYYNIPCTKLQDKDKESLVN